jgi:hypothetical protein
MQCEEVREQFADYVTGRVQDSVRPQLAEHLRECAPCRTDLYELKTLWMQLDDIPRDEPTAAVRERFEVMLQAYQDGLRRPGRNWRRPALQFLAAAALLILGIAIGYRMHTVPAPIPEMAELRSELYQTKQMVALSLMQQQSATERLKGVNWSYRLQEPSADVLHALLDTLMHDSNVNVRLATVDALRQFGNQPVVRHGLVNAISQQESPMVQIALIDATVDLRDKESVDTLRQLTQDRSADSAVRDRAQKALEQLE